jgi:DNA-binding response OmpR family regulator
MLALDSVQKPTALIVDDNVEALQIVWHALRRAGLDVMTALSGEEALALLGEHGLPHLIVCDMRMPPGMSGFDLCREVYRFCDIPAIMLTAVDEADTITRALEQHVEDYVIKPFNPAELVARVYRVLKRIGVFPYPTRAPLVVDSRLSLNFAERTLRLDNMTLTLTPTEAKLLYMLMRRRGETIPYDFLLRRLWPREVVFEDRLHVFVHRLRSKLDSDNVGHTYVNLDRGIGYRFEPQLEEIRVVTPVT